MARKLVRDLFLPQKSFIYCRLSSSQQISTSSTIVRLLPASRYGGNRQFSVFNEFSKKVKGEANRNQDFQQSVKELKGKAEELKGVTEDLKVRTKQTTEQLYKQVDGAWTEAEATAKKVSANLKEKVSAATDEVKDTFGFGKQKSSKDSSTSANSDYDVRNESKATSGEEKKEQSGATETENNFFGTFKSTVSYVTPKVSLAFQKFKQAKPIDLAKKGYGIVKDELSGSPNKGKRLVYETPPPTSSSTVERNTRMDIAIVPSKQSKWSKKWEALKEKMQGHPIFKRISGLSEPVMVKSHEIAEDIRDRWETTDNPVVHKIQDLSESVFGETATAISLKEIRSRDPSFSLPEFLAEVQEIIKPVLNAYYKGDAEVLKKYCAKELIERCKAEHKAFESQGIFFDNKILHISDAEVRETILIGDTPVIVVWFQTQQIYCVRDRLGSITDGGKDTIHSVTVLWAMQQVDVEELGEGALYPIWRLREMQQVGARALI